MAFVLVVVFVVGAMIVRNSQTATTKISSSVTTTSTGNSINTSGGGTNSAVVDLDLTSSTVKLPTVTLSSSPLTANLSSTTLTSSIVSVSSVSSIVSSVPSSENTTDPKAPNNLYVTNKDYKIWSVVWTTTTATVGKLKYGTSSSNLDKVVSDDRTSLSGKTSYSHQVTITNTDALLNLGNPTFYYKILSDNIEYGNDTNPYTYINAPLLSSPSSPTNAVVSVSKSISNSDGVVLARIKSGSEYSEYVSSVISGTNAILNIGTARKNDLKSYMSGSSATLEVSVVGPNGKVIGTKTGISLTNIEDTTISVTINPGSGGTVVASSSKATSKVSSSGTVISNGSTDLSDSASSLQTVPKTAIEDDISIAIALVFFLILLISGTFGLYRINSKQYFGRKVLEGNDD
ncbi:MAG: hypothetical protein WCO33_02405 [bacterium]